MDFPKIIFTLGKIGIKKLYYRRKMGEGGKEGFPDINDRAESLK